VSSIGFVQRLARMERLEALYLGHISASDSQKDRSSENEVNVLVPTLKNLCSLTLGNKIANRSIQETCDEFYVKPYQSKATHSPWLRYTTVEYRLHETSIEQHRGYRQTTPTHFSQLKSHKPYTQTFVTSDLLDLQSSISLNFS